MLKNSVKLTAVSLGLVSVALVSCKGKTDSKTVPTAAAEKPATENVVKDKLVVTFSTQTIPTNGGCTVVNVNHYDAKGNKSVNLSNLTANNDVVVSLAPEAHKFFELKNGQLCTLSSTTKDGQEAIVIAKYKDNFAEAKISASAKTIGAIKISGAQTQLHSGENLTFEINGYLTDADSEKIEAITDKNYDVVILNSNSEVLGNATYNNNKWEFATLVLGYDKDNSNDNAKNKKTLLIKATAKTNLAHSFSTETVLTINAPKLKSIEVENFKSYFSKGSINNLEFSGVKTNGEVENIKPGSDLNVVILDSKDAAVLPSSGIKYEDGQVKIKDNVQEFAQSKDYFKLKVTKGEITKVYLFVIANSSPEYVLSFNELKIADNTYTEPLNVTTKVLAKGADDVTKLHQSATNTDKTSVCVKVIGKLKVGDAVSNDITPETLNTSKEFSDNFTNTNGLICAKKVAPVGQKMSLKSSISDLIHSNELTVTVGQALLTTRVAPGVNGKNEVKVPFNQNVTMPEVKAYHVFSDDTLSNIEANTQADYTFSVVDPEFTPFTVTQTGNVWSLGQKPKLAPNYSSQVGKIKIEGDANKIKATNYLTVKFEVAAPAAK